MAFTAAQKKDIRKYLGVPFGFYDLNYRLESMMEKVGADATDSAEVIAWLTRLTAIDAAVTGDSSSSATYGALKKVDEVEFYNVTDGSASGNTIGLVNQGRVLINRLARAFGMDDTLPNGDYFGTRRGGDGIIGLG